MMTRDERRQALQKITDMVNAHSDLERQHELLLAAVRSWWREGSGSNERRSAIKTMREMADADNDFPVEVIMPETQSSIASWADETFGPAKSNARVVARANEEMAELLRGVTSDDNHPKMGEEMADIIIILCRVAERTGVDLIDEVNRKMKINRTRTWKQDGTGHGYHVRKE